MFRVFTSDSPLLGAVNLQQYRYPLSFGLMKNDGEQAYDSALALIAMMDLSSKEAYLDWRACWKDMVAELSELSHILKRPKYSEDCRNLRRYTLPIISADFNVKMSNEEELEQRWNDRREVTLAWVSSALTLLYKARMTGKLATSQLHAMSRQMVDDEIIRRYQAA